MNNKLKLLIPLLVLTLVSCGNGNDNTSSPIASETTSSIADSQSTTDSTSNSTDSSGSSNSSATTSSTTDDPAKHYIEGNYEYFIQSDSPATREFMKTPYIANVTSTAPSNYYTSVNGLSGADLVSGLKSVIANPSTSYDWPRYETVDENPHQKDSVFCIYVRDSYKKTAHVTNNTPLRWNREHTYPKSKLNGSSTSDSHLIFADDWKTNNARGNNKYGVVSHSSGTAVKDSDNRVTANFSSGGLFEPCDAAKGEVARATLYTYVLYGEPVTDNFTSIELCLKWHEEFPPTSWEMLRNNRNYSVQNNRNPFIDHPEYARMLFN